MKRISINSMKQMLHVHVHSLTTCVHYIHVCKIISSSVEGGEERERERESESERERESGITWSHLDTNTCRRDLVDALVQIHL